MYFEINQRKLLTEKYKKSLEPLKLFATWLFLTKSMFVCFGLVWFESSALGLCSTRHAWMNQGPKWWSVAVQWIPESSLEFQLIQLILKGHFSFADVSELD